MIDRVGEPFAGDCAPALLWRGEVAYRRTVNGAEVRLCRLPPLVEGSVFEDYERATPRIGGVSFVAGWRVLGWPLRDGPVSWSQRFVDGVETPCRAYAECDVTFEVTYEAFVGVLLGRGPLRNSGQFVTFDGSVAAFSCLEYLVRQPQWLRNRRLCPDQHWAFDNGIFAAS